MAEDSNRLFVGNIPFRMTQDELHDLFSQAGAVVSVHIPTDRETGRPRGFGFVQMEDDTSKEQAVQMFNGYSVSGRALVVNEARPREPRFSASIGMRRAPRQSRRSFSLSLIHSRSYWHARLSAFTRPSQRPCTCCLRP